MLTGPLAVIGRIQYPQRLYDPEFRCPLARARQEPAAVMTPPSHSPKVPLPLTLAATIVTIAAAAWFVFVALTDPPLYEAYLEKDSYEGAGLFENLTFLVLVPGILGAIGALAFLGRRLGSRPIWVWLLLWTLACIYFAGEEVSWGQWYFGWGTPEVWADLNKQAETNLHNTSSWLNFKPRVAVEVFIILAGLVVPLLWRYSEKARSFRPGLNPWVPWITAPAMCWAAAAYFLLCRVAEFFPGPVFESLDESELKELATAWFLALYLFSYPVRLLRAPKPTAAADAQPAATTPTDGA